MQLPTVCSKTFLGLIHDNSNQNQNGCSLAEGMNNLSKSIQLLYERFQESLNNIDWVCIFICNLI